MSLDLTVKKSAMVLVMAWCYQATGNYLSQCWPSSMMPYGSHNELTDRCHNNFENVFSKHMLWIKFMSALCKIALRWVSQNTLDEESTLVRWWLGAIRQQVITQTNVDPDLYCCLILSPDQKELTHWGRVTHICIGKLIITIIGSDNGLSPGRCQAIIWNNGGILLIGPIGTNFREV